MPAPALCPVHLGARGHIRKTERREQPSFRLEETHRSHIPAPGFPSLLRTSDGGELTTYMRQRGPYKDYPDFPF